MATQARPTATPATTREPEKPSLLDSIVTQTMKEQTTRRSIVAVLPRGVTYDQVMAAVEMEAEKEPKLLECTPTSMVRAVVRIYQWGLDIGTTAYLVAFHNSKTNKYECTAIASYQGLIELMIGSGAVRAVEARCVYDDEPFEYRQGLDPVLDHRPAKAPGVRRIMIGAYAIARLPFNQAVFEYYPIAAIDAIRKQYSKQYKSLPETPAWYAVKTAVRHISKLLPKNKRLAEALRAVHEEAAGEGIALDEGAPVEAAPEMPQAAAPTGDATEAQVEKLYALVEEPWVDAAAREKVERRIGAGTLMSAVAETWIATLETQRAKAAPPASESDELHPGELALGEQRRARVPQQEGR